jgi:uncharacterized protein with PQ loop repeat
MLTTLPRHSNIYARAITIATVLSFAPQFKEVINRRDSHGISPWYLLFNALAFILQFNDAICIVDESCRTIRVDPHLGNWFAFAQLLATALCFTLLYAPICPTHGPASSEALMLTFRLFICVSLPNWRASVWERVTCGLLGLGCVYLAVFHRFVIRDPPFSSFLDSYGVYLAVPANAAVVLALCCQANDTYGRIREDAFNLHSLLYQAAAFSIVALFTTFELCFAVLTADSGDHRPGVYAAGFCFVAVDFLYAVGQLLLYLLARSRLHDGQQLFRATPERLEGEEDETSPLFRRYREGRTLEEITTRD